MSPSKIGALSGAVCAIVLGVVLSGYGGAGVALLVLPAALVFAGIGALIGRLAGMLAGKSGHRRAER